MFREVQTAQKYLIEKHGSAEKVPVGTHAVPFTFSKGPGFMRVDIAADMGMSCFEAYYDEALTQKMFPEQSENKTEQSKK